MTVGGPAAMATTMAMAMPRSSSKTVVSAVAAGKLLAGYNSGSGVADLSMSVRQVASKLNSTHNSSERAETMKQNCMDFLPTARSPTVQSWRQLNPGYYNRVVTVLGSGSRASIGTNSQAFVGSGLWNRGGIGDKPKCSFRHPILSFSGSPKMACAISGDSPLVLSGRLCSPSVPGSFCDFGMGIVSQRVIDSRLRGRRGRVTRHLNSEPRFHIGRWARSSTIRTGAQSLEEAAAPLSSGSREGSRSPTADELGGRDKNNNTAGDFSSSSSLQVESNKQATKGVFPGGVRRAEVRIPGLVLRVQVFEVLEGKEGSEGFLGGLSSAIAEGLTMVILESGVEGEGGARLYEAACVLKSVLRGRAELLVAERVDIAAAAGADGVVLSDDGLPAVIARRMMLSAVSESAVLPLVARTVTSTQSARSATTLEGADLLLLQCSDVEDLVSYARIVCDEVSIPVFVDAAGLSLSSNGVGVTQEALDLLQAGASGIVLSATKVMDNVDVSSYVGAVSSGMTLALQQQSNTEGIQGSKEPFAGLFGLETQGGSLPIIEKRPDLDLDLDEQAKLILEDERKLLTAMVEFVQAAAPEMEEISLLVDALKQLDELFLLVVVGEFNSGKSSVINALLGNRFLKEGVLPTTNEITLLRHSGDGNEGGERSEKHPDGHYLRYFPAELLKQMNLVDTPGTNVILLRQQRLTEEFVPRADLVLFVLSVDRALTESEVTFLRYIRQWGKKIVFILNKSDVLSTRTELDELISFVRENAQSLLSVEQALVFPVSARRAILAKLAVTTEDGIVNKDLLLQDSYWKSSGFGDLEDYIYNFLEGSSNAGAERLRLKLDTPLGIGMALLSASDRQLSADILKADTDLRVLAQIDEQLDQYQQAMQADAALQRQQTTEVVAAAKVRAGKFVDSILRLSNIEAIVKYLLGSDGRSMPVSKAFDKQVIGSAISDVQKVLEEHGAWLVSNTERQTNMYGELVRSHWPNVTSDTKLVTANGSQPSSLYESFKEKQQKTNSKSIEVLEGFDVQAAEILLEQEIREVVLGTFGGLGVAGVSASVLTSILPNTLEDLLALGVCTAGGFVGVRNLLSRRQDVKNKIHKVADGIARQLGQAMQAELQQNLDQLREDMRSLTTTYRIAAEADRARVIALESQLGELDSELRGLRQKVQNLGT